jgi:predicted O-methyltransferase YrrM
MMSKHEILELTRPVEGWLYNAEGMLLYDLAQQCTGRGVIVEIGSWKGKSTIWLAKGAEAGNRVKVYAIDPHTGSEEHQNQQKQVWTFDEFKQNIEMANVADLVCPILKTSTAAASDFNQPVELVFIDGAHDYESVKQDFEAWHPKVVDGGMIAFHDTSGWEGPKQVVTESVFKSPHFKQVRFVFSITCGRKVAQNTLGDRLRNRFMLVAKNIHDTVLQFLTKESVKKIVLKVLGR